MDPDDASPATVSRATSAVTNRDSTTTRLTAPLQSPRRDEPASVDGIEEQSADTLSVQFDVLTLLVAVVGAGLLLDGVVATFAALFCLGVTAFVLTRLAVAEWRRLELPIPEQLVD